MAPSMMSTMYVALLVVTTALSTDLIVNDLLHLLEQNHFIVEQVINDSYGVKPTEHTDIAAGHSLCPFIPVSWSCNGSAYIDTLKRTRPFSAEKYGMHRLPQGTTIYAEGDSYLEQLLLYWTCTSPEAAVWTITRDGSDQASDRTSGQISGQTRGSFLVHDADRNTTLLSMNDIAWSNSSAARIEVLQISSSFRPHVIVLGHFERGINILEREERHELYRIAFPAARIVEPPKRTDNLYCSAVSSDCAVHEATVPLVGSRYMPQCIPGPIARYAEVMAAEIIDASFRGLGVVNNNNEPQQQSRLPKQHEEILDQTPVQEQQEQQQEQQQQEQQQGMQLSGTVNQARIKNFIRKFKKFYPDNYFIADRRDPATALYSPRPELSYLTHDKIHDAVVSGGHRYCNLMRDLWTCIGDHYIDVLRQTPVFDNITYGLQNVANGTFIYIEGNSHLAEIVLEWACECDNADIWRGELLSNDALIILSNTTFVVTILAVLNGGLSLSPRGTFERIKYGFKAEPDIIVMGWLNPGNYEGGLRSRHVRIPYYKQVFPSAKFLVPPVEPLGPNICTGDGQNCEVVKHEYIHQCMPGPMVRYAEAFAAAVVNLSHYMNDPACPNISYYGDPPYDAIDPFDNNYGPQQPLYSNVM